MTLGIAMAATAFDTFIERISSWSAPVSFAFSILIFFLSVFPFPLRCIYLSVIYGELSLLICFIQILKHSLSDCYKDLPFFFCNTF